MAKNRRRAGFALPGKRGFRRRVFPRWVVRLAAPFVLMALLIAAAGLGLIETPRGEQAASSPETTMQVDWVDGDSGRISGRDFRLHGVDAPEGRPQRAQCAQERALSGGARDAARDLTRGKTVRISRKYENDSYGRQVVDLSANGRDVASQLIGAGKLKRWNFDGGEQKPDWCK